MASQAQSTAASPPVSPAISSTFHQTLLWRFTDPQHARTLDQLGEILWDYVNELGQFGRIEPGESTIPYELEAVVGELRHAAGYLTNLANESNFSTLSPEERRLVRRVEGWVKRLLKIAASIELALAE